MPTSPPGRPEGTWARCRPTPVVAACLMHLEPERLVSSVQIVLRGRDRGNLEEDAFTPSFLDPRGSAARPRHPHARDAPTGT
jgi:hypothetical protein